ncbi:MAG: hypothetical protein AABX69_05295, partial [Nanoarchaeota archaeon]
MKSYLPLRIITVTATLVSAVVYAACASGNTPTPTQPQLPTLPEVRMYYGTAQKTLDKNLTLEGVRYNGPFFTFNQKDAKKG